MQTVTPKTLEDTMHYRDIPVFIYKINYPSFLTTCSAEAAQSINEYYAYTAKSAQEYCRTVLYPQAVESARYIQDSRPFNSYTVEIDYKITYNSACITSLYTDTYTYMGGAHGETKRTSDTWSFETGEKLRLNDIYPLTPASLHRLQENIELQIRERLKVSPSTYFDDYSSLLQDFFNPNSFYLGPSGFVIYYQQYDIAPYATGLPEFLIPGIMDPQHTRV